MSSLTLIFADGDATCVDVRPDETLLAAARRNGVLLASDCEVGDCQTCHAKILSGSVEYDEYATISLSKDEVAAGDVLTCVATAASAVTVQLPYERGHLLPAKSFTTKVQSVTRLCGSVVRLSTRVTARIPPGYLAGQYINLRIPGTDQWRSYSMANAPSADGFEFEFLMRLLDSGVMSNYLSDRAAPGDVIEAKGPFGTFYLRETNKPVLMIAGGTGLAPMVAMLRSMVARNSSRDVTLCFGVTRATDMFYLEELDALRKSLPSLDLRTAIMQGDALPHASGVVTDLIRPGDVVGRDIYLCGPPAMTDRARIVLAEQGVDPASMFVERFVPVSGAEVNSPKRMTQLAGAES